MKRYDDGSTGGGEYCDRCGNGPLNPVNKYAYKSERVFEDNGIFTITWDSAKPRETLCPMCARWRRY